MKTNINDVYRDNHPRKHIVPRKELPTDYTYENVPDNDAAAICTTLRAMGYSVSVLPDIVVDEGDGPMWEFFAIASDNVACIRPNASFPDIEEAVKHIWYDEFIGKIRDAGRTTYMPVFGPLLNSLAPIFELNGFSYELVDEGEVPDYVDRAWTAKGRRGTRLIQYIRSTMNIEDLQHIIDTRKK